MLAPADAAAFGGVTAPVSDYDSFPFTSPTYMFYPGVYTVNAADLGDYVEAESATLRATRTEYQYGADPLINVSIETTYSPSLLDAALDEVVAQANSCVTPPGNLDAACPFALQSRTLSLLEVKKLPTELKTGEWEPNRFQGYVTFRIQRGTGTVIQDIKTTVIATPEFDDGGKILLDASVSRISGWSSKRSNRQQYVFPGRSVTGEHGCIPTVIGVDWSQARYDTGHACVVGGQGAQSTAF